MNARYIKICGQQSFITWKFVSRVKYFLFFKKIYLKDLFSKMPAHVYVAAKKL